MTGHIKKPIPLKPAEGMVKSAQKTVPPRPVVSAPRPVVTINRPVTPLRPTPVTLNRGANQIRMAARDIKRQAIQQAPARQVVYPQPVVRPTAPPLKVMPKVPLASTPQMRKPVASPLAAARPQPASGLAKSAARPPAPSAPSALKSAVKTPARPQPSQATRMGVVAGAAAVTLGGLVLNTTAAHPNISSEVSSLNMSLADLQKRCTFGDIQNAVIDLDTSLTNASNLLEGARDKGYVYQRDLEEILYQAMDRWQPIRERVLGDVQTQASTMTPQVLSLNDEVQRLNATLNNPAAAAQVLGSTQSQVNSLLNEISQVERSLQEAYSEIDAQADTLTSRLTTIHWALTQLGEAKFQLAHGEDLVRAAPARWDQNGDQDPEGILYLSNKRLLFEQKEKVATKKVLFIAVAKELVQEVIIDQPLAHIPNVKAANKGLFGQQDYIEMQFTEAQLGTVSFHLNGQDSKLWASLLERARSSDIEKDRTQGSGLSYADLTGALTAADLMALQSEVNALHDELMLKSIRDDLAEIENDTRSLERKISELRARGYLIEKNLEADVSILTMQWERIKANAVQTLEAQTSLLAEQMTAIQSLMAKLMAQSANLSAARPVYIQVKSAMASADAQADAAADVVLTQYDEYADEVEAMTAHLEWVSWMLDALSTASFQLLATESGVAAVEAIWERPGVAEENGILFLTDQRLLWEDRVEKFELDFDLPLGQVTEVQVERDAASGQEFLRFVLGSAGPYPEVRFRLSQTVAEAWLKMIGRARAGDYALDRAVQIDPAEIERIRNAPQNCSNCGATFNSPILRGQSEMKCEYCGVATRI